MAASKAVVVEKVSAGAGPETAEAEAGRPAAAAVRPRLRRGGVVARGAIGRAGTRRPPAAPPKPSGVVLRTLTEEEQSRRAHALGDAKVREAEERKIAEEEATIRQSARRSSVPNVRPPKRASATRMSAAVTTKKPSARPTRSPRSASAARKRPTTRRRRRATRTLTPEADDDEAPRARRGVARGAARPAPAPESAARRRRKQRGRLTLVTALSADEVRERSVASFRRRIQRMTGHRDASTKEKLIARSDDPRNDHHPGTGQPHGRSAAST